jgi:hypothetical protein
MSRPAKRAVKAVEHPHPAQGRAGEPRPDDRILREEKAEQGEGQKVMDDGEDEVGHHG